MLENCKRSQKDNPSDPENYRPIAICSKLTKLMEAILNHKLMKYLEDNSLLNDRQYIYNIILARTFEIGQGLGRILICGALQPEQT